jgi:hypothetical protein
MWAERMRNDLAMMERMNAEVPRSAHYTLYENMIASCEQEREKVSKKKKKEKRGGLARGRE